ncbi:MAG TPA: hypothetical protein PLU11_06415 [Chitinophagaceae bacterium]|jgi:hypothetical protein|nr:hypothetical protein [Prolixibacteraceae bacterium]HPN58785.1 hypothetical protein [Chitinophagaceae bacterium]HOF54782.1 hypothetical protein [Prolixibacteraceae bacterium]HOS91596.1 hypothetical protein [Prolixibacteraceae bacterium]HQH75803.1 hypothetical protein [Prolixibacteraceae bacterium]
MKEAFLKRSDGLNEFSALASLAVGLMFFILDTSQWRNSKRSRNINPGKTCLLPGVNEQHFQV